MPEPSDLAPTATRAQEAASVGSGVDETIPHAKAQTDQLMPAFGPPVEPGEVGRLGPYRVVKELGHGGMGAVYAALDTRLDRQLALKVMLPQFAANPEAKERFLREARAAAKITHDNIVTVYEADERDGVPYIAMQFLQGYPLDEYLKKKGNPTIPQILQIAREAAAGLAAAHKIGLVHRDIKPGNLWLEAPNGRVKVLDFGLARPVDAEVELTKSGAIVGTPAYMAPEQARGEKVDHRVDLFSLGAVLYRLCTGKLPFEGPNTMAVLMALATREPKPVRELNPAVPESLAGLIHQLLAKDANDRPPTADEVMKRVRTIAEGLANPTPSAAEQPQVVYVPIQVTAVPEANPFADIDTTATEPNLAAGLPAEPKTAGKPAAKSPGRGMWIAAGFAAFLAACVLGGVIIIIKNKDGTETKIEVPDGSTVKIGPDGKTVEITPPGGKQPAVEMTPDRKAAEYVISIGGWVRINGEERDIKATPDLPKDRFSLTSVYLKDNEAVTDAGLANFKDCKGLTRLYLNSMAVTDAGLAHFRDCKNLTFLHLSNTAVTDAGMAHFKECKSLTQLYLYGTQVSDTGLAYLKDCKGVNALDLRFTQVSDTGLANFKDCKELARLEVGNTAITDTGLAHFKDCKFLTLLDVRKTKVTAKGLEEFHAAVPGCRILWEGGTIEPIDVDRKAAEWVLSIGGNVRVQGVDREIKAVTELPKNPFTLTFLSLADNKAVTDAGLVNLKDTKGLNILELADTPVTDMGLANFKDHKELLNLGLNSTNITDTGLANFKDCKGLMYLGLYGTKVTDVGLEPFKTCKGMIHLNLGKTAVTDAGLANFKDCKGLTQLHLSNTVVTDAGLAQLKDCKNLTILEVRITKITAKGLEEFHTAVPGCKIVHDGGIIEPKK